MVKQLKDCKICEKEYMPTNNNQKFCPECSKEAIKKSRREYYLKHRKQEMQKANQYYLEHSKQMQQYSKQYKTEHREQMRQNNKQWREDNPNRQREIMKRQYSKRKDFGFIPLNEFFEGSEFHHIDRERGLFIPIELHKSISHCVETGKNMKEINLVAFDYWSTMSFKHLKELIDKRQAFQ